MGWRPSDGFWAALLQWSRLGASALVFLVVARFLSLAEIGAFAAAMAPLRLFQVIHKSGIEDTVVIRCTDPDRDIWATGLFGLSMLLASGAGLLSLALALGLGLVFGGWAGIGAMMGVLALANLCHGLGAVPDGLLRRAGQFRILALRTVASQFVAAVLTMLALLAGAGPWALVVFTLVNSALSAAISWSMAGWRPDRRHWAAMTIPALRAEVAAISGRVLIGAAVQPILQMAVAAFGGLAAAGILQIAFRIAALLEALTLAPMRLLALPRFTRIGADPAALRLAVEHTLRMTGISSAFVYLGVFAAAPDLLMVLAGPVNGPETVGVLRLTCLGGLAGAIIAVCNQALIGSGRATEALRVAAIAVALTLGLTVPVAGISVSAVATGLLLSGLIVGVILIVRLRQAIGLATGPALMAVGAPYLAGTVMVAAVFWVAQAGAALPMPVRLGLQICVGAGVYGAMLPLLLPAKAGRFARLRMT
jgi:O-antigen/teichoic acid export membrane protein